MRREDRNAIGRVDQATIRALELTAPQASTLDAKSLRGQLLSGTIFNDFTEQERERIWDRLPAVDSLIPSLFTFFKDIKTLEVYADCLKRLTHICLRDTVSTVIEDIFKGANQQAHQALVQVTESIFASRPASSTDQVELGCRQLYAFAMRYYFDIPRESKRKDLLARQAIKADRKVLRGFAKLAVRLGFESPEITALRQYHHSMIFSSKRAKPALVTDGPGESKKRRYSLPRTKANEADRVFLFIDNLYDTSQKQGKGITSFFVRKSVFLKFYSRLGLAPSALNPYTHLQLAANQGHRRTEGMEIDSEFAQGGEEEIERPVVVQQEQEQDLNPYTHLYLIGHRRTEVVEVDSELAQGAGE
ncbi:hypothetical protein OEA41_006438 [Lepraria neglecta]|uniref:Uncharacterized protein n=1 Tax=Lepraria neglecta TaxID=209136 RepID=A0AAE0DKH3_9LECA|nr:hypothetical protein OEA41_006438 [Lepraria neglecta]